MNEHDDEMRIHDLSVGDGSINMSLSGEPIKYFFACLVKMFEQNDAENFITTTIESGLKRYQITIQNCNGVDSPAEKIHRLTDILIDAWSQFGYVTDTGIIDGGLSTLEDIGNLLRKEGYIDEKGNVLFWSADKKEVNDND